MIGDKSLKKYTDITVPFPLRCRHSPFPPQTDFILKLSFPKNSITPRQRAPTNQTAGLCAAGAPPNRKSKGKSPSMLSFLSFLSLDSAELKLMLTNRTAPMSRHTRHRLTAIYLLITQEGSVDLILLTISFFFSRLLLLLL